MTDVIYAYNVAKNKDIDPQLSGYDPYGLQSTFMQSRMTLSSMCPVRNPQGPPSTPMKNPPCYNTIMAQEINSEREKKYLAVIVEW